MIIVIDGPAGAGKSTTAKEVAWRASLDYVDSGAIYRGFTYLYIMKQCDKSAFLDMLDHHNLRFDFHLTDAKAFWGDREISGEIRSVEVNNHVSEVAAMPEVRDIVRGILREISRNRDVILEGRDLGTVVFPDADIKFFLTADQTARAHRRYKEQTKDNNGVSFDQVEKNVIKRDRIDSTREIAPLKKADDAVEIDSTHMSFEEQVVRILDYIRNIRTTSQQQ